MSEVAWEGVLYVEQIEVSSCTAFSHVAELVKSFVSPNVSKVLTTSATRVAAQ